VEPLVAWSIVAATTVALSVAVIATYLSTRRKLTGLRQELSNLSSEVSELRRVEGMRYLKGLRSNGEGYADSRAAVAPSAASRPTTTQTDRQK
jgi:uncharacterized membrane protein (DUF106 family)